MPLVIEFIVVAISVVGALTISLYATWLLVHRFRKGDSKRMAFGEWIRNILQAIWGL